jgi:hypothetical protein
MFRRILTASIVCLFVALFCSAHASAAAQRTSDDPGGFEIFRWGDSLATAQKKMEEAGFRLRGRDSRQNLAQDVTAYTFVNGTILDRYAPVASLHFYKGRLFLTAFEFGGNPQDVLASVLASLEEKFGHPHDAFMGIQDAGWSERPRWRLGRTSIIVEAPSGNGQIRLYAYSGTSTSDRLSGILPDSAPQRRAPSRRPLELREEPQRRAPEEQPRQETQPEPQRPRGGTNPPETKRPPSTPAAMGGLPLPNDAGFNNVPWNAPVEVAIQRVPGLQRIVDSSLPTDVAAYGTQTSYEILGGAANVTIVYRFLNGKLNEVRFYQDTESRKGGFAQVAEAMAKLYGRPANSGGPQSRYWSHKRHGTDLRNHERGFTITFSSWVEAP